MVYPSTAGQSASDPVSRETLGSSVKPKGLVSPLRDPINLLPDMTSESIQPVIGLRRNDTGRGDGLLDIDGANIANRSGPGQNKDTLTSRVLGPSSLAPAVAPVDPRSVFSPAPAVLEIPKRHF